MISVLDFLNGELSFMRSGLYNTLYTVLFSSWLWETLQTGETVPGEVRLMPESSVAKIGNYELLQKHDTF